MNESRNNETIAGSVLFIIFLFLILTFLVFRFGGRQEVASPEVIENIDETSPEQQANLKIYQDYINLKNQAGGDSSTAETQLTTKMEEEISVPEPKISIERIGIYDSDIYLNSFENIWIDKYNKGILEANKIFVSQTESPTFLVLSTADREAVLDSANLYESFAVEISKTNTPANYKMKSEEAMRSAFKISYILKKIIVEKNEKFYTLWVAQYAKEMANLNTARYVK